MPAAWEDCISRDWPGITDKKAFCAWWTHQQTGKWPSEKRARPTLKKSDCSVKLEVKKIDHEQRKFTGWVAVVSDDAGFPIVDSDDHIIPVMELEKAVHEAFAESGGAGKGGDMHTKTGVMDVVESFVVTVAKREALGLGKGPEGWIATFRVNDDELWEQIKSGERPELSMRGEATGVWV